MQEHVPEIIGHLLYFGLLGVLSATTVLICLLQTIRERKMQSRFLLPAAWAVYNAVGPVLFFLSAGLRRSKSLEMGVELLRTVSCRYTLLSAADGQIVTRKLWWPPVVV